MSARTLLFCASILALLACGVACGATAAATSPSSPPLKVQSNDNSYTFNGGQTGFAAYNVRFSIQGNTINGSLNYQLYDRNGPTSIVQLFVAVEREVVAVIYNGIPGPSGVSGSSSFSFNFDQTRHGNSGTIYLAGTWAMSVELGRYHYEQQNGGWRCAIGGIGATSSPSLPSLHVQSNDNSYTFNAGQTGFAAYNVRFSIQGNTINGSLNYQLYDKNGPTSIVQLFVAVEREVVAVVYNGIPGPSGVSGSSSFSFNFDQSRHGNSATIYLAGTWATSVEKGRYHYEQENGGWRCAIGGIY